jgi:tRNA(His) 5'-end guanylyltransferase
MPDSLGDRMKSNYELRQRRYLTRRTPVIVRVDGKAFHTFTRGFEKPFDQKLIDAMMVAALQVFGEAQGCKLAYVQSDEVSFVLTDYDNLQTDGWFNYNQSKIESITASCMTMGFNQAMRLCDRPGTAMFDARAFNIPEAEVANYFLWRAQDWHRNSITMYTQSFFSHQELQGKTCADMHEMLHGIGKNWTTDLYDFMKNGIFIARLNGEVIISETILPKYGAICDLWDAARPKEID